MSTLLKQEAKQSNIPHRNLMPIKNLQKAMKDTIIKYKSIIFVEYSSTCLKCLDESKTQVIDNEAYYKG